MSIRDLKKFKNDMNEIGIKVVMDKKAKILPENVAGGFDPYVPFMNSITLNNLENLDKKIISNNQEQRGKSTFTMKL